MRIGKFSVIFKEVYVLDTPSFLGSLVTIFWAPKPVYRLQRCSGYGTGNAKIITGQYMKALQNY